MMHVSYIIVDMKKIIQKIKTFFLKKKNPETVTISQTEYDMLNSFWNEHHS